MPSFDKRLSKLEDAIIKHLEESGEIRSDLRWLKKAFWFLVASPLIPEVLRHIWK